MTPIHEQPIHIRQQILLSWTGSYLKPLRAVAGVLIGLFSASWFKTSPTFPKVLGHPRAPVHGSPSEGFDFSFLKFHSDDEPEIVQTDVVIIGSGCGAGVSAKNLAELGQRVIVVDKAYYFPPKYLPMSELDAAFHLFGGGNIAASDEGDTRFIYGQAWGGGGTVNWSASLQTQNFVRQEWADGKLPFFTSAEYQNCLDRVCERMGVSDKHIHHNHTNRVIAEGARKLGYNVRSVPQNTNGKQHYCGYCSFGCASADKQGPSVSWLPDAARAGAQFVEGFEALEVLFETTDGQKRATGVKGTWRSRDSKGGTNGADRTMRSVIIKAKRTIVSCGSMQSPLLLLRSGLTNPQIGCNLHVHPCSPVYGVFPYETKPWDGSILTAVVESFQDLDGHGHGVKIEAMNMFPGWTLPGLQWHDGPQHKAFVSKFKNMAGLIALTRDRDTGRVYLDKDGRTCRVSYSPSSRDRAHSLEGAVASAKMLYIQGAREIYVSDPSCPPFLREDAPPLAEGEPEPGVNDPRFQAWLAQVRKAGLRNGRFGTAHQMGTCRMSATDRTGVVDPTGKVWGCEGLYVADASVFPSASGVNPMVTTMAISDWISRGIAREMKSAA